jgi:hypothetical protein
MNQESKSPAHSLGNTFLIAVEYTKYMLGINHYVTQVHAIDTAALQFLNYP